MTRTTLPHEMINDVTRDVTRDVVRDVIYTAVKTPLEIFGSKIVMLIDPISGLATFGVGDKISKLFASIGGASFDWAQNTASIQPDLAVVAGKMNGQRSIDWKGASVGTVMVDGGGAYSALSDRCDFFSVLQVDTDPPATSTDYGTEQHVSGQLTAWPDGPSGTCYLSAFTTGFKTIGNPTKNLAAPHLRRQYSVNGEFSCWINGDLENTFGANTFNNPNSSIAWGTYGSVNFKGQQGITLMLDGEATADELGDFHNYINHYYAMGI